MKKLLLSLLCIAWLSSVNAQSIESTDDFGNDNDIEQEVPEENGEDGEAELQEPTVSFPEEYYEVEITDTFESPVATTDSDGVLRYSSSKPNVAEVDPISGKVTIIDAGTTVITAEVSATETFTSGAASYTLTVTDETIVFSWEAGGPRVFEFSIDSADDEVYGIWTYDARYGLKGSAYKNSKPHSARGIAATPLLDFSGSLGASLTFRNAFNNYTISNEPVPVEDISKYAVIVVKVENEEDWTEIENAITVPHEFSWSFYNNEPVILKEYAGKKFQIGFKYVSTTKCAGTWEIDNILVRSLGSSGVTDIIKDNITNDNDAQPVYYNLQGIRVNQPVKGVYIMVKGNKSKKIIF